MGSKRNRNKKKNSKLVADIPSIEKLLFQLNGLAQLGRAVKIIEPLFLIFRKDAKSISKDFEKLATLQIELENLVRIINEFNEIFADHGWIMFDNMNLDVARKAVEVANADGVKFGEQVLIEYYNEETLRSHTLFLSGIRAFRPRIELAEKAIVDYAESRYYSSVLVVLTLIDGLVNELHSDRRGFFSDGADLNAWDSIAANESGLGTLANLFRKGRRKTSTEELSIPYRNGIIHGMDLGYDNIIVAAKCWAGLFAVGDWARRAERGELSEPQEEARISIPELFDMISKNKERAKLIEEWCPRGNGQPFLLTDTHEPGSPEETVNQFLLLWSKQNYGHMASLLSKMWHDGDQNAVAIIRRDIHSIKLNNFKLISVKDEAAAISEVVAELEVVNDANTVRVERTYRVIYESSDGMPETRNRPGCYWKLIIWHPPHI
ncbi:MAG: hypothetical protein KF836_10755 [Fimbriimonadaceae bacterium]|nr:hypothetical protein [Fimbriimonadaceae bacterium]